MILSVTTFQSPAAFPKTIGDKGLQQEIKKNHSSESGWDM
jgi:hypothetical protein